MLGLRHSFEPGDAMCPYYAPDRTALSPNDKARVAALVRGDARAANPEGEGSWVEGVGDGLRELTARLGKAISSPFGVRSAADAPPEVAAPAGAEPLAA